MKVQADADYEARCERALRRDLPIYEFFGLEVRSARNGTYSCFVPYRESNLNHIDTIHAGIQWSASEVVGGLVMMTALEGLPLFSVVKAVSIEFKRPARSGITVEAHYTDESAAQLRAEFEREGEVAFSLRVVARDEDQVEVAAVDADYIARRPRA